MLEIRWHSRAGQGAVTGAKSLADVISKVGQDVQAFSFYGSAKRGTSMTSYNRISKDNIINHEKFMKPDYVFVIDPAIAYTEEVIKNTKSTTKYIVTTHLDIDSFLEKAPIFKGKEKSVYVLDCVKISLNTIGRAIPNAPMLGAFIAVSKIIDISFFTKAMNEILSHSKFSQEVVDGNLKAISQGYDAVLANCSTKIYALDKDDLQVHKDKNEDNGWDSTQSTLKSFSKNFEEVIQTRQEDRPYAKTNSFCETVSDWRVLKPVFKEELCIDCQFCWIYCPDTSILAKDKKMIGIDYKHCKGCGICSDVCPTNPKSLIMFDENTKISEALLEWSSKKKKAQV